MKSKKYILISTLLLLSIFISACSSAIYASTGWHGLASSTDTAYLAAGGQVYAVDLTTGTEKWRYPTKANAKGFYANPVLTQDGSQLLVPGYDNILYSLDPATGAEKWKYPDLSNGSIGTAYSKNRLIASPLVTQDMIYQPSSDDHIYALDLNGKYKWEAPTGGPIWATPATDATCGCIYVASMDHYVYKFDAATGTQLKKSPDLEGALVSRPAVSTDGVLYVGTFGKEMIALDAINGSIKWRFTTQDWVWSGPVLANNVLYFGDLSGYLYALNTSDGSEIWRIQPQNAILDTPVVSGDNIYFTTEADTLYVVSTAGSIINSRVIGGVIYTAPVIIGDAVLVAPTNYTALLVALKITNINGNPNWMYTPAK